MFREVSEEMPILHTCEQEFHVPWCFAVLSLIILLCWRSTQPPGLRGAVPIGLAFWAALAYATSLVLLRVGETYSNPACPVSQFWMNHCHPQSAESRKVCCHPIRSEVHRMGQERSVGMVAAVASVCAFRVSCFFEECATVRASIGNC